MITTQSAESSATGVTPDERFVRRLVNGTAARILHASGVLLLFLVARAASGQVAADTAVQMHATVQKTPPKITLAWPANGAATSFTLYRKPLAATSWGASVASLPGTATGYADTTVAVGTAYEYRVTSFGAAYAEGYVATGIEVPLVESRGKVILIVDSSFSSSLAVELARLESDLAGDGWIVLRHDVARTETVPNVKDVIHREYVRDPANVKYVFLFGHVPVPYAGAIAPDGHGNHYGAWPADIFYGDMDGVWTDSANYDSTVAGRQHNVAGDGKYDQSTAPGSIELGVGRVDLSSMPAFAPKTEFDLLRQYLNKDHNFRHRLITAQRRGLIDDNFGYFGGEAFAGSGWRNFSSFFGAANVFALDWFTTLATQSYLWAYGCGGGNFTGAGGVGSTSNFVSTDTQTVFTMLFGSYFGDWDVSNNFLRAPLATTTYGLTDAWSGRPVWHFHHMGLGEVVGFGALATENGSGLYMGSYGPAVHIALMGDPTLRMHIVAPPTGAAAAPSGGAATISWTASPDAVLGYDVYRSTSPRGPFTRLNGALVTGTSFPDSAVASLAAGTYTWGIRAVMLESGAYFNASQADFAEAAAGTGSLASDLSISIDPSADTAVVSASVAFRVRVEDHGPADGAGVHWSASFPAGLSAVSVLPSTGCTVAANLVSCNVGALARGTSADFTIAATATAAGAPAVAASIAGTVSDPSAANDTASASVTVLANAPTTTLLSTSLNPSTVGQSVTFTATVTSSAAGAPSGSVTFKDGTTSIGTGVLNAAGQATLATTTLPIGARSITARFAGDAHFGSSVSTAISQSVRANSSTTVSSSANPAIVGSAVAFTAHVTSASGTPTGSVTFADGGTSIGFATLDGSGNAIFATTTLAAGAHSIVASYTGDTSFNPSASSALSQTMNAAAGAATSTVLVSSLNPADAGQPVTLTATVTSGTAGTITGVVSFISGSSFYGSAPVGGSGVAALATSSLPPGNHLIAAYYSGSATYNPSHSANLSQTVRAATQVAVTSSLNPSAVNQSVTFTVTITGLTPFIGYPGGTAAFSDGTTVLGSSPVSLGRATLTRSTLAQGSHPITVAYSGDALFVGGVSPVLNQVVTGPQVFADVPPSSPFFTFVNTLAKDGITAGCGGGNYCPGDPVTRAQVATFLLKSKDGAAYVPPTCTTAVFSDVPCSNGFAPWVNELSARGVTSGCAPGKYCPATAVTRAQVAVFLLKTKDGSAYTPPACTAAPFADVPCASPYAIWIQELVHRGITTGCGGGNFCPGNPVTRGQVAVFLVTTFGLI